VQWIRLDTMGAAISATPVAREAYAEFAYDTGRLMPHSAASSLPHFITGVGATDASAFARWLSHRHGEQYRLPILDEMLALAYQAYNGLHIWPSHLQHEVDGSAQDYFYEWLACAPDQGATWTRRHCVTHPAWLLARPPRRVRAALADTGYPSVVFRLVRSRMDEIGLPGIVDFSATGKDVCC
jgi:hypothetical protein